MINVESLYNFIDEIAPFNSAMDFDNVGLLIGNMKNKVNNVLVALDVTREVIEEAERSESNVIITHHPVIFKPLRSICNNGIISSLIKKDINVICAHTNLDIAENGVNYWLALQLGLGAITKMKEFGVIGCLSKEFDNIETFALYAKECLNAKAVRYTDVHSKIKKVAVCSGSGGDFLEEAFLLGADVFLTGEIKHSQILKANDLKIPIVDAGHFKTENVFVKPFIKLLQNQFKGVTFFESKSCDDKINFI